MNLSQAKEYWRCQAEKLLATDMPVREWCRLNKINKASMYSWLSTFADEEPDLFGGSANIADRGRHRWLEDTRKNMHEAQAMIPASQSQAGFMIIDTEDLYTATTPTKKSSRSFEPIVVSLNGAEVHIPADTGQADIDKVLRVVSSL